MLTQPATFAKVPTFATQPQTKILALARGSKPVMRLRLIAGFSVFGLLIFPHSLKTLGMRAANRHHVSASNVFETVSVRRVGHGESSVAASDRQPDGSYGSSRIRELQKCRTQSVCAPLPDWPRGTKTALSVWRVIRSERRKGFSRNTTWDSLKDRLSQVIQCRKLSPNVSARMNTGQSETQVERGIV